MHRVVALAPLLLGAAGLTATAEGSGAGPQATQPAETEASAQGKRMIAIKLPRAPRVGERVWLIVRTGPLKVGTVIRLTTPDGLFVGAITPFGLAGKPASLEFQVAVPPEAFKGTDLVLDTEILDPGTPSPRAPTQAELIAIEALVQ